MRDMFQKKNEAKRCLKVIYNFEFLGRNRLKTEAERAYEHITANLGLSKKEIKLLAFLCESLCPTTLSACMKAMHLSQSETDDLLAKLGFDDMIVVRPINGEYNYDEDLVYFVSDVFYEEFNRSEALRTIEDRQFHDVLKVYAKEFQNGLSVPVKEYQKLERIINLNPNLQFSKGYKELAQTGLSLSEKYCLFFMAGVFVRQGLLPIDSRKMTAVSVADENTDIRFMDNEREAPCGVMEEGIAGLLNRGYVVVVPDDAKEDKAVASDKRLYLLSEKVCGKLFKGMTHLIDYGQLSRMADVIKNEDIKTKELFFDEQRDRQLELLKIVLQPTGYARFVKNLQKNGMTGGVTALFHGAPGTGKTELAKQLARTSGRDIFIADVAKLYGSYWGESEKNMRELFRSFRYLNALSAQAPVLLFNEADGIIGKRLAASRAIDKAENAVQTIVLQELESFEGIFIATTNLANNLDEAFDRRFLIKVEFCAPSPQTAAKIWMSKIPELTKEEALYIASRFPFSGGKIDNVTKKRMLLQAANNTRLSVQDMMELCRNEELKSEGEQAYFRHFQIVHGDKIKPCKLFYDENIMPSIDTIRRMVVSDRFDEMVAVLKQEGLSGSVNILLHGAPGTGKTELVLQLARESRRDVYVVDVAKLHEGLVGDAERNVRELFAKFRHLNATAERSPILLFNEADGIIGKRLQVDRASDKEENSIQSVLLQELENFEGIFMATTNLIENIDEAFDRRFLFKIEFQKPSPNTAVKIWQARIPELSDDEALLLATEFSFSGGQIDNIAKRRAIVKAVYQRTPDFDELRLFCLEEQFKVRDGKRAVTPAKGFTHYINQNKL